jgi:hypothetical protein
LTSQVAERPGGAQARAIAFVDAVPVWAWLTGIVAASALTHFLVVLDYPAPYVFVDELVYSGLAKSFAATGHFALRGVPTTLGYAKGYPVLISPWYALFGDIPRAYDAIRIFDSILMSTAAVPAYFIARRIAGPRWALFASVLTVAIPPMLYTSVVMTESAFYPAFLLFVWSLVAALERPTPLRQLAVFGTLGLAYVFRPQALALLPAILTAILLLALLNAVAVPTGRARAAWRTVADFWVSWALVVVVGVGFVVYEKARDRPLRTVLGAYEWTSSAHYTPRIVLRWFIYHLAEIDLAVGVIPVAAFIVLVALAFMRNSAPELRVFTAVALPTLFWLTLVVAAFASKADVQRIEERNLFYVMPFFLIAVVAWVARGAPRPPGPTAVAVLVAGALPGVIPFAAFLNERAVTDTYGLLLVMKVQQTLVSAGQISLVVVLAAIAAGAFFAVVPRRLAALVPLVVLVFLALSQRPIERFNSQASADAFHAGIGSGVARDWIDRAVGRDADVAAIYTGERPFVATWDNEFFNRSLKHVYNFGLVFDGLPQTQIAPDPKTGLVRDVAGNAPRPEYVLADDTVLVRGKAVSRDPVVGETVYKVGPRFALVGRTSGIYPDGWSGPTGAFGFYACEGGTLTVTLLGDPALTPQGQTVVASAGTTKPKVVARTTARPGRRVRFTIPLVPENHICSVSLAVSPTAVPAQRIGTADARTLGIRMLHPVYSPS